MNRISSSLPDKAQPLLDADPDKIRLVENEEEYKNDDDDLGSRQRSGSWLSSTTSKSQNSKPVSKVFQGKSAIGEAGFFSRFLFTWAQPILSQAHKELLQVEQFGELCENDKVETNIGTCKAHYNRYLSETSSENSLLKAVFRTFRNDICFQLALNITCACLTFGAPFLILMLINFIQSPLEYPDQPVNCWLNVKKGVYISIALVLSQLFAYLMTEHMFYLQILTGYKSSNLVSAIVYQKHAQISNATNKEFTPGEVVNFVQVDAQQFVWMFVQAGDVAQVPFVVVVCFGFLYYYLSWAFFAGFGVFLIAFVVNTVIGIFINKTQKEIMEKKDARMSETNESLNNIKMLKLYSWQELFEQRIIHKRSLEVGVITKMGYLSSALIGFLYLFPNMMPVVCFTTYIGLDLQPSLDLATATSCLIFFGLMAGPMAWVPMAVSDFIQLCVSMKRVQKFLMVDEVQTNIREHVRLDRDALEIKGNFSWGFEEKKDKDDLKKEKKDKKEKNKTIPEETKQEKPLKEFINLRDLDINIRKGEFVCVIGDVGSGKTSLLSAIIGEMIFLPENEIQNFGGVEKIAQKEELDTLRKRLLAKDVVFNAPVKVDGKLSYVEQQAWIQNCSIRDNILFNKPLDRQRYINTIIACQLESDLAILPAGDMTEIGEKGINLSGGQKARVSLARAVYSNNDVVLMDDPISALDANVRKLIFKEVFQGLLRDKTRILVTHAVDFLHLSDRIIVMSGGSVQAFGTFKDLQNDPHLIEVLNIYKKQNQENQELRNTVNNAADENRESVSNSTLEVFQGLDQSVDRSSQLLGLQRYTQLTELTESQIIDQSRDAFQPNQEANSLLKLETEEAEPNESEQDIEEESYHQLSQYSELRRRYRGISAQRANGKIIANEADEEVIVKSSTYKQMVSHYGGIWIVLSVNIVMTCFMLSAIYNSSILLEWSDQPPEIQQDRFKYYTILCFSAGAATGFFVFMRVLILICGNVRAIKILHNTMLKTVLCAPINLFYDVTPIGKILNRFSKDLMVMDQEICYTIGSFLACFYQAVAALVVAVYVVPYILIPISIMMGLGVCIFRFVLKGYKECYRLDAVTKSPVLSFLQETQSGCTVIRAFGSNQSFQDRNIKLINNNILMNQVGTGCWEWYCVRMDIISTVVVGSACAFCILGRSHISPVLLALLLRYILTLQTYCVWTLYCYGNIEQQMVSVQRFVNLKDVPQERKDHSIEVDENWPSKGVVEFKNVTLKYRPTTEAVLRNLSFVVQAGMKVGVVGRTGAGKSTICISLSRIVELFEGCIEIDGVDIAKIDLQKLREKVTVIPQDPTLFTGTLKFNLDPYDTTETERIEELINKAGLSDLLIRSANAEEANRGINMKITEGGKNLSSGERQLICICRAILRKNKIVILDEATANIDVVTEKKIQELINLEFKESTVITIAHRLNTIIKSNYVLVLSRGTLVEYDSPKNLIANPQSEFTKLLKELKKKKDK